VRGWGVYGGRVGDCVGAWGGGRWEMLVLHKAIGCGTSLFHRM
jgi:hypothetical protein